MSWEEWLTATWSAFWSWWYAEESEYPQYVDLGGEG